MKLYRAIIAINFSDAVQFCIMFYSKFTITINDDYEHLPVETKFSTYSTRCTVITNHHDQMVYRRVIPEL